MGTFYISMKITIKHFINYIIPPAVDFTSLITTTSDGAHTTLSAFLVNLLREDELVSFWIGEPPPGRQGNFLIVFSLSVMEVEKGQRPILHNKGVSGQIITQYRILGNFEAKRKRYWGNGKTKYNIYVMF